MASIRAKSALTPSGWQKDVRLTVEGGRVISRGPALSGH